MAKLVLLGDVAQVQLIKDAEDGMIIATCHLHRRTPGQPATAHCTWGDRYDTMDDAVEYAANHADDGRLGRSDKEIDQLLKGMP